MTPAVRIMYTAQLHVIVTYTHVHIELASFPGPRRRGEKGPGLISTICTCAKFNGGIPTALWTLDYVQPLVTSKRIM